MQFCTLIILKHKLLHVGIFWTRSRIPNSGWSCFYCYLHSLWSSNGIPRRQIIEVKELVRGDVSLLAKKDSDIQYILSFVFLHLLEGEEFQFQNKTTRHLHHGNQPVRMCSSLCYPILAFGGPQNEHCCRVSKVCICLLNAATPEILLRREAACRPVGTALIAEHFESSSRGIANGIYSWGIYIGYGLSFVLGNYVPASNIFNFGWRATFVIGCLPGLPIALAVFLRSDARYKRCSERPDVICE